MLCRQDTVDTPNPVKNNIKSIDEHYGLKDDSFPTNFKTIMQNQQKDNNCTD